MAGLVDWVVSVDGWLRQAMGAPDDEVALPGNDRPPLDGVMPVAALPASGLSAGAADPFAIRDMICGPGHMLPGGAEEAQWLARPLGLSEKTTLLLLAAGRGGEAAAIAAGFGTWAEAYEADHDLLALCEARLQREQLTRRVHAQPWHPAVPWFKPRAATHALALMPLRGIAAGPGLHALAGALRPGGNLVLLELVADRPLDPSEPAVAAWIRAEQRPPPLSSGAEITQSLVEAGFDVRVVEDEGQRHRRHVLAGWQRLMAAGPAPLREARARVLAEAELWMQRLRLMEMRRLRLVRWHAILAARPPGLGEAAASGEAPPKG